MLKRVGTATQNINGRPASLLGHRGKLHCIAIPRSPTQYHTPHLSNTFQPSVQCIARHLEVRLVELVLLGPPLRSVSQPLLDDGMEPGQQEVQASSLVGLFAHASGRHCAEGAKQVGLHTWRRFKGEDAGSTEKVDWNLGKQKQRIKCTGSALSSVHTLL